MKNFTKLVIVVIALIMTTNASFAQNFGIKAGLNLATMLMKDDDYTYSDDLDMKLGFHLGVTAEFPISEMISFETGLLLTQKGYKFKINWFGETWDYTFNLNYLEVPLMAKVTYDLGGAILYGQFGPYVGFGLTGKYKFDDEEEDVEWGSGVDDDIKRLDFGLNAGIGLQVNNITIGASYGLGLMNVSPDDEDGFKANNRVIGFSVGYRF